MSKDINAPILNRDLTIFAKKNQLSNRPLLVGNDSIMDLKKNRSTQCSGKKQHFLLCTFEKSRKFSIFCLHLAHSNFAENNY